MIQSLHGIVLRRRKDAEADLLVWLLAEDGLVYTLRFHGIEQSRSRSTQSTEIGSVVDVRAHMRTETVGSVKEASIVERFDNWKSGYRSLALLSSVLEFVQGVAAAGEPGEMYRLLLGALREGEKNSSAFTPLGSSIFFSALRLRGLAGAGLLGDCAHCSNCGERLGKSARWIVPELSFLCHSCAEDPCEEDARLAGTMERILAEPFSKLAASRADEHYLKHVQDLAERLSACVRYALPFPSPAADALIGGTQPL